MSPPRKLLLAALVAAAPVFAQQPSAPPARNDLLTIYRDALANDPTYASARFAQQAAVEVEPQARSALLPNVSAAVGASSNYFNSRTPDFSRTYSSWGPSISASMPLYDSVANETLSQAKISVAQSTYVLEQARQDLILRVSQAYFDVLAAQDDLTAIEANKQAVSEQLAQARREFEVGTKTIVDTHEAQARYDLIVAQEQVALGTLIVRQNALRAIIGRDPGNLLALREPLNLSPPNPRQVETWARQAEESSYSVQIAQANSDIARIEVKRQRDAYLPTVDLVASANQNRSDGTVSTNFSNTTRGGSIGVQLNVPIYTGGLIQSRVRQALANEERSRQDLEGSRRTAAQAARGFYTGVDYGLSQVKALESAEVSARSQLDSTRLGYRVGIRINLDVLNATTQLFLTQRDLKKARYDYLLNGLRLENAVGSLDEADLDTINALLAR